MKTTVLAAACLAVFAMPAFAEDAAPADETVRMSTVDPATTSATTPGQSDMKTTTVRKHGCMHSQSAEMM
jgi:hypothetical protein